MLQSIREKAQGWIAWAIVILISIPFALWGINSYLGVGAEPIVASVNGQEITERDLDYRYQRFRTQLRERLGGAYRPELFDDAKLRREVLQDMITELLLTQASLDMGLRASNQEIRTAIMSEPAFQRAGQFDKPTYQRALELQGMSEGQFEESLRQQLVTTQLQRMLAASEVVTEKELTDTLRLNEQTRDFSYFVVPHNDYMPEDEVGDQEIATHYQAHEADFETPEQVKLEYLVLNAATLAKTLSPTDEDIQVYYESERDRFQKPEQRTVRHILINLEAGAEEDLERAARERVEDIAQRLANGEDFAAVAREASEDPGSADQGGDLGQIEAGIMDPAFDEVTFALGEGEISDPVRTKFGYHLVQVTEIEAASIKPLDAVRDEIAQEVQKRQAESLFYEWAERLGNLTYENPDSLQPAAESLGLALQTSDWMTRQGGEGLLAHPKITGAAFSEDVLQEGNNSEVIEPDRNVLQAVVLRVTEHQEASIKPLNEVREQIIERVRENQAKAATQQEARERLAQLQDGAALSEVAGSYELQSPGLVGRQHKDVPRPVLEAAFTLPHPAEGEPSFGTTDLTSGDAAVIALSRVEDGTLAALPDDRRDNEKRGLSRRLARQYYEHMLADLEKRADIEITLTKPE
jgi:peptidyl-prolyl cis-trans isomerase D